MITITYAVPDPSAAIRQTKVSTSIVLNNANEKDTVRTDSLMHRRYVVSAITEVREGKTVQLVRLTNKKTVFTTPLFNDEDNTILVVLDGPKGILNPLLTVNNWAMVKTRRVDDNTIEYERSLYSEATGMDINTVPAVVRDVIYNRDSDKVELSNKPISPKKEQPDDNSSIIAVLAGSALLGLLGNSNKKKDSSNTSFSTNKQPNVQDKPKSPYTDLSFSSLFR